MGFHGRKREFSAKIGAKMLCLALPSHHHWTLQGLLFGPRGVSWPIRRSEGHVFDRSCTEWYSVDKLMVYAYVTKLPGWPDRQPRFIRSLDCRVTESALRYIALYSVSILGSVWPYAQHAGSLTWTMLMWLYSDFQATGPLTGALLFFSYFSPPKSSAAWALPGLDHVGGA